MFLNHYCYYAVILKKDTENENELLSPFLLFSMCSSVINSFKSYRGFSGHLI